MTGAAERAAQRRNRCAVCGALPGTRCDYREHEARNAWPLRYWPPDQDVHHDDD